MCGGIGSIDLPGCPRDYVGCELTDAINLASFAGKGAMPVSGGLLDQSAWFVDLWQTLESDQNRIDTEKAQDRKRGR